MTNMATWGPALRWEGRDSVSESLNQGRSKTWQKGSQDRKNGETGRQNVVLNREIAGTERNRRPRTSRVDEPRGKRKVSGYDSPHVQPYSTTGIN